MAKITINGNTLDPSAPGPALAAANLTFADASQSNYILIQTRQPLTGDQKAELAAKGVKILEYVPENTYMARYDASDLASIRALPYVDWADVYLEGFKVDPALDTAPAATPGPRNLLAAAVAPGPVMKAVPKTVDIVFHRDVDPNSVRDKVAAAAGVDPDDVQVKGGKVRLTVDTDRIPDLAGIDAVRHIEEVTPYKLLNDVARKILRLDNAGPGPGSVTLQGEGQIVAVADTGFDKGSTTDVHPAFTGRVAKLYALGRSNKANDPDGHGTHVAGSVLGDGNSTTLGPIRGTAPKARLVLQSVLDRSGGLGGLPDDLHDLFSQPYENDRARVHTNSWGSVVGDGSYNQNSFELDDFVWNHRDCVICFAAGNEGTDRDANGQIDARSVTPPGTARNCITVGATENNRPEKALTYGDGWPSDFPVAPIAGDRVADNPEGMVAFSSRGPTADLRIKPDVVAPGTYILSTRSRVTSNRGWETTDDPLYFFEGGTSMATPLVAGCTALVREHLIKERSVAQPTAALVKAMLINGAHNITGQYTPTEAGTMPNNAEGFGRVDVAATVGPLAAGEQVQLKDEATQLDTGQDESTAVSLPAGANLLKVTLVWTDPAGEALQNDLDLIVRAGDGQERHGNVAAASAVFDRANNVEQVVWTNPPAGTATVTVRAHRITLLPQPYALVIRTA